MWRRFLIAVALLLVGSVAYAQSVTAIDVTGLRDGKYVLEISGSSVLVKPLTLIIPGVVVTDPEDPEDPDEPTDPTDLTERAQAVKEAALAVAGDPKRAENARDQAALIRLIADKVDSGELDERGIIEQAVSMTRRRMLTRKEEASWKPVVAVLTSQMIALVQEEGGSPDAYAILLREYADGLDASADGEEMAALDLEKIMKFIMWFLEVILPLLKGI